jgi:DNA-binding MarR family transcriptional regulator
VIASTTAADLIEALRTIVRTGRGTRQAALFGELPGASVTTLVALDRHGEQRMGELAERLCVDPSVVSRQVATLARSGFVARRPDPIDGRAQLLGITDAGRDAIARYRGERIAWVARALEEWDDDEAHHLVASLHRLADDLRQTAPAPARPSLPHPATPAAH